MDRNEPAAPIDLEALRAVLSVLKYEAGTIPFDSRDYGPQREQDVADIEAAHRTVQLAISELTTRRARDAEVGALVSACRLARSYMSEAIEYETPGAKRDGATVDAALAPFTGATR
jgi:hypothetical protein